MTEPIFFDLYDKEGDVLATINLARVDVIHTKPADNFEIDRWNYVKVEMTVHGRPYGGYIQQAKLNKIRHIYGIDNQSENAWFAGEILKDIQHRENSK